MPIHCSHKQETAEDESSEEEGDEGTHESTEPTASIPSQSSGIARPPAPPVAPSAAAPVAEPSKPAASAGADGTSGSVDAETRTPTTKWMMALTNHGTCAFFGVNEMNATCIYLVSLPGMISRVNVFQTDSQIVAQTFPLLIYRPLR